MTPRSAADQAAEIEIAGAEAFGRGWRIGVACGAVIGLALALLFGRVG